MHRRAVLGAGAGLLGGRGVIAGVGAATPPPGSPRRRAGAATSWLRPVARLPVAGAADCRVSADGRTAFVAVGDGFLAVDVPTMEAVGGAHDIEPDREGGPLSGVADLAVDGDRLLVPGPADPTPGRLAGAALFDVSDPTAPEEVAFHETSFPIHNAALANGLAYLSAVDALVDLDVTDDDPVAVGRWSLADVDPRWRDVSRWLWICHDVRVRGDLAVCSQWDAGTWLVDVGDPSDVTVVGRIGGRSPTELASIRGADVNRAVRSLPGNHHSAALDATGTTLAIGREAFAVEVPSTATATEPGSGSPTSGSGTSGTPAAARTVGGPGGLDLYDLSHPSSPTHMSTIDPLPAADETVHGTWTTVHDFAFDGDRLLAAWYQGGVTVHDVSDPADPVELARWRRPDRAAFWTARPAVGDTFVAPTTALPAAGLESALYRFPSQPDSAVPPSAGATLTVGTTPATEPTTTATPPSSAAAGRTTTSGQPGFGPASALGALGAIGGLAWWRGRRRQE